MIFLKTADLAQEIDEGYWWEIVDIVRLAVRKNLPLQAVVDALKPLGYEVIGEQE